PGPNPTRGGATVRYTIPAATEARLAIYDGSGRNVRTLTSGPQPAGVHTATWDGTDQLGRNVGAGVYLVRLTAGGLTRVSRLTVVR
ncbi:MAG: FlgD immunoglobulin-like domain containing protein, partial [bacterium]